MNEAVVDGLNMLLTPRGRYAPRPGYVQYGIDSIGETVRGAAFFQDVINAPRFVVGTPTRWYTYLSSSDSWDDITDLGDPLTGTPQASVRFVTFFQASKVWVLGCNNNNQLKRWDASASSYINIPSSFPCRDIAVVANRVLLVNTFEAGIRRASRVRWSSESDATTYPPLGFFDLTNAGEPIVGVKNLSRTTAAVYRTKSIWLVHAQAGGDATAFYPELVSSGNDGPVGPAAIVDAGRSHYFLGRDSRVYRFDGVEPIAVSAPIDAALHASVSPNYWELCNGVYFSQRKEIWFFVVKKGETIPRTAFVYDLDAQRWEVEQRFPVGITASALGEEQRVGAWDDDHASWDSDKTSWDSEIGEPELVTILGTSTGQMVEFGRHHNDGGASIPVSWTLPVIYTGESDNILPQEVENFFAVASELAPTLTVHIYGLKQPLGVRTLLYSGPIDVSSAARLIVSTGDTGFTAGENYYPGLQLEFTGLAPSANTLEWGGGHLIVYNQADG